MTKELNGKRITVMMDNDLHTEIRNLQAKLIPRFDHSISFSAVLCAVANNGLKDTAQIIKYLKDRYT